MILNFPHQCFMDITTSITDLSLSNTTREQVILDFTIMASTMDYGPRRILRGFTNLLVIFFGDVCTDVLTFFFNKDPKTTKRSIK